MAGGWGEVGAGARVVEGVEGEEGKGEPVGDAGC